MKANTLFLSFILGFMTLATVSANAETVTCELSHDAPVGAWRPSGRRNYDQTIVKQAELSLEESAHKQTEIIYDESLNSYFSRQLKVTGNIHLDPKTQKKKLFVGLYEVRSGIRLNDESLLSMMHVSETMKTYDGREMDEVLVPVVSGMSDTGSVELLAENYGSTGSPSKVKLSCSISKAPVASTLNFSNRRERFSCDVFAGHYASNKAVQEQNKQVILGYNSNEFMRDLQPIIEDKHFSGFFANVKIMANLFVDKETNQTKLLLGIYKIWRHYDAEKHGEYWVPDSNSRGKNGGPFFYAQPQAEVITTSDYAEVITASAFDGYAVRVSCKKATNNNQWAENYSFTN